MGNKVLITSRSFGKISNRPMDILTDAGMEVTHKGACFDQEEFNRIVKDYDALIIGAHPFPEDVMEQCKGRLRMICKHGAGLDNIPLEKAKECGITVCNAPGTNSNAVADLAFGLMLMVARRIKTANANAMAGKYGPVLGTDVYGKTLGLLGFGAIAKNVAHRAKGFSMNVLAYDPYVTELPEEFREHVTLTDVSTILKEADFISAHLPLTDETRDMIAADELAAMKEGAIVINTARGGIVNEKDLYDAVASGHIAGAGIDATVSEPIEDDNPLKTLENVVITPHIGMYSTEATEAVSIICAENVASLFSGGELQFKIC